MLTKIELLVDYVDAQLLSSTGVLNFNFLPLEINRTGILGVDTCQYLHHGRLAGAVFTDQSMDLAGLQLESALAQSLYTGKSLVDAFHSN